MQIRPYAPTDAAAVIAFTAAAAAADPTLRPVTARGWREYVAESWNRGGRDFRVAAAPDGTVVGVLFSSRNDGDEPMRHFRVIVHPKCRNRGLGSRLLAEMEAQERPGTVIEQANCESGWTTGAAFLERRGFACHSRSYEMVRDGPPPPAAPVPPGVTLRTDAGDRRDAEAWIALCEEGYRGTPGYARLTLEDVARHRTLPGSHTWVAEDAGPGRAVLGHCRTVLWQGEEAWIDSVVVTAAARGRGIGRALTAAGLGTLAESGHARVKLNVRADNPPALRTYESLGFRVEGEVRTYRRRRAATAGSGARGR